MEKSELLTQYNKFPYAVDAIFYFIFNCKDWDNIVFNALRGSHGRDSQIIDYSLLSEFMMGCEDDWYNNLEDINEFVANLNTFGGKVSDYY